MAGNHSEASRESPGAVQEQSAIGTVIDARGLNCPLPVLKLRKHLKAHTGQVWGPVELIATDRAALKDVPAYCRAHGLLVEIADEGAVLHFVVRPAS